MSLRIAIDASRTTRPQPTGTENYALRLIQALIAANESRAEPYLFSLYFRDTPPADLFANSDLVEEIVIPFPRLWTHLRFATALLRARPDITFVPAHTLPFVFPGAGLVTVHDLGYRLYPEAHSRVQRAYLELSTRLSQRRAALVLADSEATAADLNRFYGTRIEKIRVVYPGLDGAALKSSAQIMEATRAKYQLPARYFVFLGTLQPRKNIGRIVKAFRRWQREHDDGNIALVLAGAEGWLFDASWLEGARNIIVTGYIDEADKGSLLAGAIALVFPSLYEGFGFPAVEAMHCGTPVIASETSSLPELVGDAGLLVDPLNVPAIAEAMGRCSDDAALRKLLIKRGYRRAKQFTWDAAAQQVMAAFDGLGGRASTSRSPI
ncbi:MAG: glycosyltransferase family 1 protein [Chloroflexi bacterium]|nr:glycosyltransferase family 1 protein [Chloroflexota bacterium]